MTEVRIVPHLERLRLIDPPLLRALIAWPAVPKLRRRTEGFVGWGKAAIYYQPHVWMIAAALPTTDHDTVALRCSVLGFIDEGGELWEPVLWLARAQAARLIGRKPATGGDDDGGGTGH